MSQCPQCNALMINGIYCHETGCPEAWRNIKVSCFECGCHFVTASSHCRTCPDCIADAEAQSNQIGQELQDEQDEKEAK